MRSGSGKSPAKYANVRAVLRPLTRLCAQWLGVTQGLFINGTDLELNEEVLGLPKANGTTH